MKKTLIAIGVLLAVLGGSFLIHNEVEAPVVTETRHQTNITLGNSTITVDIADTEPLREQGLSGTPSLDDAHGMLFVFQTPAPYSFWMKDMLIPIDMIWLSSEKKVIHIVENAAPESYPSSFTPPSAALYVVEVAAGWAQRHGVVIGSAASF